MSEFQDLVARILQRHLPKPNELRLGTNWESTVLTTESVCYAGNDARAGYMVYNAITHNEVPANPHRACGRVASPDELETIQQASMEWLDGTDETPVPADLVPIIGHVSLPQAGTNESAQVCFPVHALNVINA